MAQQWSTINTYSPPAFDTAESVQSDAVPSAGASDGDGVAGDPENLKKKTAAVGISQSVRVWGFPSRGPSGGGTPSVGVVGTGGESARTESGRPIPLIE